jgi:hypothetical protein
MARLRAKAAVAHSAGAGEEERKERGAGRAGLLGRLDGMGQKATGPKDRKIKLDFQV